MKEGNPETANALSTFLSNITTVLTSAVGWMGTIITEVMENPVLLVPCVMGLAFTGVALFKSLRR